MATSYVTLTGDLRDLGLEDPSALVWIGTNLADGEALVDKTASPPRTIMRGRKRVPLTGTTFSVSLMATNNDSTDTNIVGSSLRYILYVEFREGGTRPGRASWESGPFALTANMNIAAAITSSVPAVLSRDYVRTDLVDAKGDLLVGTAADTVGRLPVGANGTLLRANSADPEGVEWSNQLPVDPRITGSWPAIRLFNTDGTVDQRQIFVGESPEGDFLLETQTDAGAGVGTMFRVYRTRAGAEGFVAGNGVQYLSGTGSPEGAVSAGVGSRYSDRNATNGAVEWIKASGTGNTGWRVVYGDTGRREVSSLLASGVTATSVVLSRRGYTVELSFATVGALAAYTPIITLPTGFSCYAPAGKHFPMRGDVNTGGYANFDIAAGDVMYIAPYDAATTFPPTERFSGSVSFLTADAWPSSLPGTPA